MAAHLVDDRSLRLTAGMPHPLAFANAGPRTRLIQRRPLLGALMHKQFHAIRLKDIQNHMIT